MTRLELFTLARIVQYAYTLYTSMDFIIASVHITTVLVDHQFQAARIEPLPSSQLIISTERSIPNSSHFYTSPSAAESHNARHCHRARNDHCNCRHPVNM